LDGETDKKDITKLVLSESVGKKDNSIPSARWSPLSVSRGGGGDSHLKHVPSHTPSLDSKDDMRGLGLVATAGGMVTGRTVGEIPSDTDDKDHDGNNLNSTFNRTNNSEGSVTTSNSVHRNVDSFLLVIPTYTLYNEEDVVHLQPRCSWRGHGDSASDVIALHEHSCFVTASHDGYLRVWNIDSECLGELPLPNMTEKMRLADYRLFDVPGWKFVLERMELGKAHRDLAAKLISEMTQGDEWHEEHPTLQRKGSLNAGQLSVKRKNQNFK